MDYNQNDLEVEDNNSLIESNVSSCSNSKKWKCDLCTYENWPSAVKCTLCQTMRKPTVPVEASEATAATTPAVVDNDIYKLATLKIGNAPQPTQVIEKYKWNCSTCTYLNWPKSKSCVQCSTPRSPPSTQRASPVPAATTTTPKQSPLSSPSLAKKQATITAATEQQLRKWPCKQCTYQNWPKAQRCIMCATLRQAPTTAATQPNIPLNETDRLFLAACKGIYENDLSYLSSYIETGADLARYLTQDECKLLNSTTIKSGSQIRAVFHVGLTLIHLCYQYKHKDELMKLLNRNSKVKKQLLQKHYQQQQQQRYPSPTTIYKIKFSPCQSCPMLATNIIERYITSNIRQRKFDLTNAAESSSVAAISLPTSLCYYINDLHTFTLPAEIEYEFIPRIQKILFYNLFDYDVQYELEIENKAINWCPDLVKRFNSKLYALWNRHSGDCLLDSVLQACYGVFDKDNTLRQLMYECLETNSFFLKARWKEHELLMAKTNQLNYTIDDIQLEQDWQNILQLANTPGSSLEQAHIFALCHILRRPIIIYSIKYVKNHRSENIGLTYFEGVYLPLLWEPNFCFKNPITLGYTRGHFTALVHIEGGGVDVNIGGGHGCCGDSATNDVHQSFEATAACSCSSLGACSSSNIACSNNATGALAAGAIGGGSGLVTDEQQQQLFYLPLTNHEGHLLPVHFLTANEVGREHVFLRQYLQLDRVLSPSSNCNVLVAQLRVAKRSMLVKQMLDEWLNYYRSMQIKDQTQQITQTQAQPQQQQQKQKIDKTTLNNINNNNNNNNNDEDDEDEEDDEEEDDDVNNDDEFVVDVES